MKGESEVTFGKEPEGGDDMEAVSNLDTVHLTHLEKWIEIIEEEFASPSHDTGDKTEGIESGPHHLTSMRSDMAYFLRGFGIDAKRFLYGLALADPSGSSMYRTLALPSMRYFISNARCMVALEKNAPGAVTYLYEKRGIRNFSHYSHEFWERQYSERDSQLPYMLVVKPQNIEKEALTGTRVYMKLQDTLSQLSVPHNMRLIEIEDVADFFRILVRLDRTYNDMGTNPIPAVLYDGHGTNSRLLFGKDDPNKTFGVHTISDERFYDVFKKYLIRAFTQNVQFIFGSCEAGDDRQGDVSLGYKLKKAMSRLLSTKARVTASRYSLYPFSDIGASFMRGVLSIQPKALGYDEDTSRVRPNAGFRDL